MTGPHFSLMFESSRPAAKRTGGRGRTDENRRTDGRTDSWTDKGGRTNAQRHERTLRGTNDLDRRTEEDGRTARTRRDEGRWTEGARTPPLPPIEP